MDTLFFILEHIYRMTHIPIRCLDSSGAILLFLRGNSKENDVFLQSVFKSNFLAILDNRQEPFIECDDDIHAYAGVKDTSNCYIIIGPVTITNMLAAGSAISMIYYMRQGKTIRGNALFFQDNSQRTSYEKNINTSTFKEEEVVRHSYNLERAYTEKIKSGDIEGLHQLRHNTEQATEVDIRMGRLAKKTLKHFEYMACTIICLASRAAIEGGLDPESAYSISDIYFQRLEKCNYIYEILALQKEVTENYTNQVKNVRESKSKFSHVEKCKLFIIQNLLTPFTLEDIAEAVHVNKYHLSRIFSQEEDMSIMAYARKKRIEAAANMLKYSDENIATIAQYLCFRNQSHFSRVFKELLGYTPQKYRFRHQTIEFRE